MRAISTRPARRLLKAQTSLLWARSALLASLLVGSLPGIWLGANLTRALPERLVRAFLSLALVVAGLKVLH